MKFFLFLSVIYFHLYAHAVEASSYSLFPWLLTGRPKLISAVWKPDKMISHRVLNFSSLNRCDVAFCTQMSFSTFNNSSWTMVTALRSCPASLISSANDTVYLLKHNSWMLSTFLCLLNIDFPTYSRLLSKTRIVYHSFFLFITPSLSTVLSYSFPLQKL